MRGLHLNHPLNYLVVPYLRLRFQGPGMEGLLALHWPDLGAAASRRYAIEGARVLGLVDEDEGLTLEGEATAELLAMLGFDLDRPVNKRARLVDEAPGAAAVGRLVLGGLPETRLVVEVLWKAASGPLTVVEVYRAAERRQPGMARALFLADRADPARLEPASFRSSTVYQFKQILWHTGILETRTMAGAGQGAAGYRPVDDRWGLDPRYGQTVGE